MLLLALTGRIPKVLLEREWPTSLVEPVSFMCKHGVESETFQDREGSAILGHFYKHFAKTKEKKALLYLKTTF